MTTDAILTELRALPGAPDRLRERVRALPEPKPRLGWTPPSFDVRRSLLVLAPAIVALGVGAAALHGVLSGETTQRGEATARGVGGGTVLTNRALAPEVGAVPAQHGALRATTTLQSFGAALAPQPLPPSATRLNRYEAWLRVKVERDELARAATRAMQIARGYGGYVASVDMNTPGRRGRA